MRLQLLSDLHLETEQFDPERAPGAELLVLAGDIDSHWVGLERFAGWPNPVVFVAGNHEFDGRDLDTAMPALRQRCLDLGITPLERESLVVSDARGRRIRIVATTRWSDFDLYGIAGRAKAMRAGEYFAALMQTTHGGEPFDAEAIRAEALVCRAWLEAELMRPPGDWERTVVITHFAPSLRSADPRYGHRSGTASFCNADDDLIPRADLWLHGHLHCAHDYHVSRAGGSTRVVCNSRGHERNGEAEAHQPLLVLEV
ncbi:MAG TPA: metallophosphoesterase [Caldimonas sp.]|nr:metallophosphoesterase [Caldimonas sp.]